MMPFRRGDIVRLKSDERRASFCVSEEFRDAQLACRYIVLGIESGKFAFTIPSGESVMRPRRWYVWQVGWPSGCVPMVAPEDEMIATGERAEETT